jgi:hypothetical protein
MKLTHLTTAFALLIPLILCSCNTTENISDENAISDKERVDMVNFARHSLNVSKKILTDEDKALIMKKEPEIKEYYASYKTGRMAMSWELTNKKVTIIATGRLLSDAMGWELAVTKKEDAWTTKNSPGAKNEKTNPKDFLHLINKS